LALRRAGEIQPSPTVGLDARAKELARQGIEVISFGVGEPDFPTTRAALEEAERAMREGFTRYTPVRGIPELRRAIADKTFKEQGLVYDPEKEILVSSGAKESIFLALLALVDPGEEVLLPAPYWVSYPEQVRLAGGRPVVVPSSPERGFRVGPDDLAPYLTERTRVLILNSPQNPSGTVYPREELGELARFCLEHDLWVVADEIYEKLVFQGEHVSLASFPGMRERTVVVNGVSKAYAMTGWRVGWALGPAGVIGAMASFQSHTTTHPSSVSQRAALGALLGPQDQVAEMVAEFRRRRDFMVERLSSLPGFRVWPPEGAFYVFPSVEGVLGEEIPSDLSLAERLLEEARIAAVPGSAFGMPGYLRFSYALSFERMREGLERLERFVQGRAATRRA